MPKRACASIHYLITVDSRSHLSSLHCVYKRAVLLLLGAVVLDGGWCWFRPERAFFDRRIEEPEIIGQVLLRGEFRGIAHETSGEAELRVLPEGGHSLRLKDFMTSDGPQVEVYLVAADDAPDNETVARSGYVSRDPLKGNLGAQNYVIPVDVDLSRYRFVSIWCKRFGVNFGVAPLREGLWGVCDGDFLSLADSLHRVLAAGLVGADPLSDRLAASIALSVVGHRR